MANTKNKSITLPNDLYAMVEQQAERRYGRRPDGKLAYGFSEVIQQALRKYFSTSQQEGIPQEVQEIILKEWDQGLEKIPKLYRGVVKKHIPEFLDGIPPSAHKYKMGEVIQLIRTRRGY